MDENETLIPEYMVAGDGIFTEADAAEADEYDEWVAHQEYLAEQRAEQYWENCPRYAAEAAYEAMIYGE